MSKGFSLVELVMTIVVLAILSAFTFSVIWQYSQVYTDTRGGYVYGEAAAVLERITRELRDAGDVYTVPFGTANPAPYINFSLTHGTPATGASINWVQYCICSNAGSNNSRALLYRVILAASTDGDQCQSGCPAGANAVLMSGNIMSSHSDPNTVAKQGFRVQYFQGSSTPDGDSYMITLALASDRTRNNALDNPGVTNNPSITLVTRISPRNYTVTNPVNRSFNGNYYDEIK
jgi:prepilin-type N-terminal cleavage/methylation domain-containing protein